MSNETKKFAGLESLQAFLDGCKTLFASITHKHTMSDITDYTVDSELSSVSTNPVQNKAINAEFDAISQAFEVYESELDGKLNTSDYVVDSELNSESTNPVQNAIITAELDEKMNTSNPTGTGSFSLNRKSDTTVGNYSFAEGYNTTASRNYSHAEGYQTTSSATAAHAEGSNTKADNVSAHAEGDGTTASGSAAHAEGLNSVASGVAAHAEGGGTIASGDFQHVQGLYNISNRNYIHIVGNGTSKDARSNAHTLDKNGNAWYAGTLKLGGTSYDDASEVALKSDIENIDLSEYATTIYVDEQLEDKADKEHVHEEYETKEDAQIKLDEAKDYTDIGILAEANARETGDTNTLNSAKAYADSLITEMELITVNDIDTICGQTIQVATASEVMF